MKNVCANRTFDEIERAFAYIHGKQNDWCVLWIQNVESSCQGLFGYHDSICSTSSYHTSGAKYAVKRKLLEDKHGQVIVKQLRAIHSLQKLRFQLSFVSSIQQLLYTEQDPSCITHDLG